MNRRALLRRCAGVCLLTGGRTPTRASDTAPADLTIAPEQPGLSIPRDFLGLSYESALLGDPEFFSPGNHSLLALIRRLGPSGVIRIGGNSSEYTLWRPHGGPVSVPKRTVITPADIRRLAAFMKASG